jgi:hypothetical protein
MNEQITLLALKASDPKTGWLDRQKFAELIIRECAEQVKNLHANKRISGAEIIREHFGVEE